MDESFVSSETPLDWRSANITPIFKKGDRHQACNYRPISLTSVLSKIMESIRDHILDHFQFHTNNLFSKKQFGFLKGRSTVLQLLTVLDDWTKILEEGGQIDVIYTDLEKAFDKVPHHRLLMKL